MRLLPTRLALIALVAGFVSIVGPTAPAGAAPVPCVQTFEGRGATIPKVPDGSVTSTTTARLAVPASSDVEDVDVTVSISHEDAGDLRVDLNHAGLSNRLQRRFAGSGPQVRPLTWDDEATVAYAGGSQAGTYQPEQPLSRYDGSAAGGTWELEIVSWDAAPGTLSSWSVRISYSSCDGDDDGVEDHVDNCDPVANPDQSDLDRDGIGDACDGDPDGDGVGSQTDNCPQVSNATQVNSDADALGDACDADDDDDSRADVSDGCPLVGAATSSGCPAVATKVRLRKEKSRLVGRVRSDRGACVDQVRATVKQKLPGRDPKLVVVTTKPDGRFRTRLPKAAGRYYVVVRKRYAVGVAECGSSRSAAVRVRR